MTGSTSAVSATSASANAAAKSAIIHYAEMVREDMVRIVNQPALVSTLGPKVMNYANSIIADANSIR